MLNSPLRGKDLMTCDDLEPLLAIYVDGELGSPERDEVEAHLSGCDDCRSESDFHKNFKRRLHQARDESVAKSPGAPPNLKLSILSGLDGEAAARQSLRHAAYRAPLAMAAVLAVAAGGVIHVQRARSENDRALPFLASAVASHQREMPLEVSETGGLPAIKSWFKGKVDFSPNRIPNLQKVNLVGARLSNISDRQAAYVSYTVPKGNGRVSLFVFDAPDLHLPGAVRHVADRDVLIANQKGYNVAIWKDQEIAYSLVSDLDERDVLELVAASSR